MTPHPLTGAPAEVIAWRLDKAEHAQAWNSGEGAYRVGGRWNSRKKRVVYCSVDPSTAIVEVAVHRGFRVLDTTPHILTAMAIHDPRGIKIVTPSAIPNPNWLHPGMPSAGQQSYGDALLADNLFVLLPSVVSTFSWNLIFDAERAQGLYRARSQTPFALDPRLHPAP